MSDNPNWTPGTTPGNVFQQQQKNAYDTASASQKSARRYREAEAQSVAASKQRMNDQYKRNVEWMKQLSPVSPRFRGKTVDEMSASEFRQYLDWKKAKEGRGNAIATIFWVVVLSFAAAIFFYIRHVQALINAGWHP